MPDYVPIQDLTILNTLDDSDYIPVSDGSGAYAVRGGTFKDYVSSDVTAAKTAAQSAQSAAEAAQTAAEVAVATAEAAVEAAVAAEERFENISTKAISDITDNTPYEFTTGYWINTSGTVDVTSKESHTGAACLVVPCAAGDVITITGTGFTSSHTLYAFINSSGTKRAYSGSGATASKRVLEAKDDDVYLVLNVNTNYQYSCYKNRLITERVKENTENIGLVKDNALFLYTDFTNGNINSSGKNSSSDPKPLRSGFIPIDEFVSVKCDGKDPIDGSNMRYQLFAYNAAYEYLGFGGTTRTATQTRADVLTAFPTTKYVRIKIGGGNDEVALTVDNLDAYGYEGYTRITFDTVKRNSGGGSGGESVDIMSLIESMADENGKYTESFSIDVDLLRSPLTLTVAAQYMGSARPTIQIQSIDPTTGNARLSSPAYILGGTKEPTRKSWRIPMSSAIYTKGRVIFAIPLGTVVTIRDAYLRADQRNRFNNAGIRFHGHRGSIAPADTVEAFQLGAELGYNTMITIPHFTTDGVGVCYHDDGNISDLRMLDGSTIPDADTTPISSLTYEYLTENYRIASTLWGMLHVPTLEEFFRVCSLTGMTPTLSIHSSNFGATWSAGFTEIKRLAKKWGVLKGIGIKSGSDNVFQAAKAVFEKDARYIWLNGQSHDPYNVWTFFKSLGFIAQDATDLTGCEYNLASEYFYAQTVPGAEHYDATIAQIADLLEKGFPISVAETSVISGAEMERLINIGVTEFTVDSHISMGLDW